MHPGQDRSTGLDSGMPFQPHWRIVPGSRFRWREWDGEFVLYHENSGDTHRLNPLGARAVRLLLASAASARELTGRIAAESPMDGNATLESSIDQLLVHLHALGLVEPVAVDDGRQPSAR